MGDASVSSASQGGSTNKFVWYIGSHIVGISIIVGVIASLILPVCVVAWKVSLCNYGWDTDFSGLLIFFPVVVAIGAGVGALFGSLGERIADFLKNNEQRQHNDLIGAITGVTLALLVSIAASIFPAGMLMFPDC